MMDRALALTPSGATSRVCEARVAALVRNMMKLAFENETLLRTMIHQTVLEKEPFESATPRHAAH